MKRCKNRVARFEKLGVFFYLVIRELLIMFAVNTCGKYAAKV
jgi:hypothetical protein